MELVVVVMITKGPITTVMAVACDRVPLVPVTKSVYVPDAALLPALIVRVEVAVPPLGGVTELASANVTPDGADPLHDADNATEELKLPKEVTTMGIVAVEPGVNSTVPDDTVEKSDALPDMTFNVSVAEWDRGPLDPLIVSV